jgi:hypothetical protein
MANRVPNLTPVRLTSALTLEFHARPSHSPSTFRAHPVPNARDHFCGRFEGAEPDECHISPHLLREPSGLRSTPIVLKHNENQWNFTSHKAWTAALPTAFLFPQCEKGMKGESRNRKLTGAHENEDSFESRHQNCNYQLKPRASSRLRSPAPLERSFPL